MQSVHCADFMETICTRIVENCDNFCTSYNSGTVNWITEIFADTQIVHPFHKNWCHSNSIRIFMNQSTLNFKKCRKKFASSSHSMWWNIFGANNVLAYLSKYVQCVEQFIRWTRKFNLKKWKWNTTETQPKTYFMRAGKQL